MEIIILLLEAAIKNYQSGRVRVGDVMLVRAVKDRFGIEVPIPDPYKKSPAPPLQKEKDGNPSTE